MLYSCECLPRVILILLCIKIHACVGLVVTSTYHDLSHALKNTANQRPGLPLHILRYATGNMQRYYSTLLSRHSLRATVYRCPFEDFSKASSETFQLLRAITTISDHIQKPFPKISEHFRRFLENLKKS